MRPNNRAERRAFDKLARHYAKKLPDELKEWPRDQWWDISHSGVLTDNQPLRVWKSKRLMVQLFIDGDCGVKRLSINLAEANGAEWKDGKFTWDDLMEIKRACGFGETYAVEVYPRECDVINVANIRHLWLFDEPLQIGWFRP
jgi:hypothetical protein